MRQPRFDLRAILAAASSRRRMHGSLFALALSVAGACRLPAQATPPSQPAPTAADSAAIRSTALDYIEGWFTGDSTRMRRAVYPALANRIVDTRGATARLDETSADELVRGAGAGYGTHIPDERRRTDVRILDIYGNAASVRIDAGVWIDYLHLGRFDGQWKIVNVLWEMRPRQR